MLKSMKFIYFGLSVLFVLVGMVVAWDPIIENAKEGLDFIGRSILASVFLIIGFYGVTMSIKFFQSKE